MARKGANALKGKGAPIKIHEGDMFELDWWSDADIIYVSNLCFSGKMNERILELCTNLKQGTKVILLKKIVDNRVKKYFKFIKQIELNMTWGCHETKLYVRV